MRVKKHHVALRHAKICTWSYVGKDDRWHVSLDFLMKLTTNHGMLLFCLRIEISHFGLTQNSANVRAYEEYGCILSAFQQTICVCMKRKEASGSWLLSVSLFSCNTYPFFWSSDIYLSEISELNKNLETCQWYTTGILILKCENNTIWVMSQKTNVILMTHELTGTVLLSYLLSTRT